MASWPQEPHRDANPEVIWALVAAFAALDFFTPILFQESHSPFPSVLFMGVIVAQPGLLAVWAVLGPQRFLVRWPLSFLAAASLWFAFLLGVGIGGGSGSALGELATSSLVLPLVFLAVQFPLWILKMLTGWRLVVAGTEHESSSTESRQFRLQQMMAATTAIAVALGLAGTGLANLNGGNTGADADTAMWLGLMIACLIAGVASALATLPCLWAAFVARDKATGAVIFGGYAMFMGLLLVALAYAILGPGPPVGEMVLVFGLVLGSLACVLLGSLHAVRSFGYTLLRPRRRQPLPTPAGSCPFADPSDLLTPSADP